MIAPSILSADFANLERDLRMINASDAAWIHVDIMDGVFVPNLSFGLPVTEAIKRHAKKPLDVHLMIVQPERYIEAFHKAGADVLTVHYEASTHLHRSLQEIRAAGMKAGVALNPHSPVDLLADLLGDLDLVCLMSVNPGFGGQAFIPQTFAKVERLRRMLDDAGSKALIEIDGGVSLHNAADLKKAGADVLVAGNAVFKALDPADTIRQLNEA
ncbi:MAG: ribulose-phosphate 3-epimerase [Cryomorphaceae bacterium]|nr:ribulose-phosphate 3-epimerase [Cryomorphaceae bacterium]